MLFCKSFTLVFNYNFIVVSDCLGVYSWVGERQPGHLCPESLIRNDWLLPRCYMAAWDQG